MRAILVALNSGASVATARGYTTAVPAPADLSAGTAAQQDDQLFKERAYWMYLTSHRLGDLRRLIRQYGRPVNAVFPNGPYFKGGLYGTDVNVPVPFQEQNNPQYDPSLCKQNVA